MIDRLLTALKCSGAIGIILLTAETVRGDSTEYVFSAPPEVDNELVEIPTQETDYPFYECDESAEHQESETAMDSHDCDCPDCEVVGDESEEQEKITSRKQQKSE